MASNPDTVTCTKDAWVKAADSVENCVIHKMDNKPSRYFHTYRVEDDTAPSDLSDAVEFDTPQVLCNFDEPCDVYIFAKDDAGKVRVDS